MSNNLYLTAVVHITKCRDLYSTDTSVWVS